LVNWVNIKINKLPKNQAHTIVNLGSGFSNSECMNPFFSEPPGLLGKVGNEMPVLEFYKHWRTLQILNEIKKGHGMAAITQYETQ